MALVSGCFSYDLVLAYLYEKHNILMGRNENVVVGDGLHNKLYPLYRKLRRIYESALLNITVIIGLVT